MAIDLNAMIEVSCPVCGEFRKVQVKHFIYQRPTMCLQCKGKMPTDYKSPGFCELKDPAAIERPRITKKINGCEIVKMTWRDYQHGETRRCKNWFDCDHRNDCLNYAADHGWDGWKEINDRT